MKRLTFFQNNRFFLVSSLILGLLLPLLAPLLIIDKPEVFTLTVAEVSTIELFSLTVPEKRIDWHVISKMVFKLIYLLGVGFMLVRLVNGLWKIFQLYKTGEKVKRGELIFAYNEKPHLPFSFMNVIFLSRNVDFGEKINKVITHEIAHVKQWHSIDVLMTEILQVFFWFNPILIFYKKSLKDAHEYIADRTVVSQSDYKEYVRLLLQTTSSPLEDHLVNSFFNSQIKSRIAMLNINKSNRKATLRYAIIIPMIGLFTYLLASSKMIQNMDLVNNNSMLTNTVPHLRPTGQNAIPSSPPDYPPANTKWVNSKTSFNGMKYEIVNRKINGEIDLTKYVTNVKVTHDIKRVEIEILKLNPSITDFDFMEEFQQTYLVSIEELEDVKWNNSKVSLKGRTFNIVDTIVNGVLGDLSSIKGVQESLDKLDVYIRITGANNGYEVDFNNNLKIPTSPQAPTRANQFKVVEEMPRFPGCEIISGTIAEKEDCAKNKLMQYLGTNVSYPKVARENNIQGQAVVKFVILSTGEIADVEVLRDPGGGLGAAAKEVIESMNSMSPKWIPGRQRGQAVNVEYTVPIKFKLADIESDDKTEDVKGGIVVVGHGNTSFPTPSPTPPLPPPTAIWKDSKTFFDGKEYEIFKMKVNGRIDLSKYGFNTIWKIGGNEVKIDILGIKNSDESSNTFQPPPPMKAELFKIVEEMPRFPGCEDLKISIQEKEKCAKEKLLQYIGDVLVYPMSAMTKKIEGQAVVQFTIKKDGSIEDVVVLRDPGAGLGNAAKEAVLSMNNMPEKWIPGKQRGVDVAVQYTIPVKFKLNNDDYSKIDASIDSKNLNGSKIPKNIIYVLDGEVIVNSANGESALSKIDPSSIKSIDVHKNKDLLANYTDRPNDYEGLIIVTTKNPKKLSNDKMKQSNVTSSNLKGSKLPEAKEYYVNGLLSNKKHVDEILPSSINSIEVIKETKNGNVVGKVLIETNDAKESPNTLSIKAYPNPSPKERVNLVVQSNNTKNPALLKVYDVSGKMIHSQLADIKTGNLYIEIDLTGKVNNTSQVLVTVEQGKEIQLVKVALN